MTCGRFLFKIVKKVYKSNKQRGTRKPNPSKSGSVRGPAKDPVLVAENCWKIQIGLAWEDGFGIRVGNWGNSMRSIVFSCLILGVCSSFGCNWFGHQPKPVKMNETVQEFTVAPTGYDKPADLPREDRPFLRANNIQQLPNGMPAPGQPGGATPATVPGRPGNR